MNFYEIELNGETIKFRLKSSDAIAIEKKTNKPILDFIQDSSMTSIITMLTYLRRGEATNFSEKEATELYDLLIDNGYTMEEIVFDIIFEALVVSGFLKKDQLKEIKGSKEKLVEKEKEKLMKQLEASPSQ